MQERVYKKSVCDLKQWLMEVWAGWLRTDHYQQWKKRLWACVKAKGQHFDVMLWLVMPHSVQTDLEQTQLLFHSAALSYKLLPLQWFQCSQLVPCYKHRFCTDLNTDFLYQVYRALLILKQLSANHRGLGFWDKYMYIVQWTSRSS